MASGRDGTERGKVASITDAHRHPHRGIQHPRTVGCSECGTEYLPSDLDNQTRCHWCNSGCSACVTEECAACEHSFCIGCMRVDLPVEANGPKIGTYCPRCADGQFAALILGGDRIARAAQTRANLLGTEIFSEAQDIIQTGARAGHLTILSRKGASRG